MRRTRRYADWRPVATRRIPARWIGILAGTLAFAAITAFWQNPSYFSVIGAIAFAAYVTSRVAARRLDGLRDEEEDRQFAVTLRLDRATSYGHDEGLVSFEDGYLVYMGRRCAFSHGAGDVRVTKRSGSELEFEFRGPKGKHTAHLQWKKNEGFTKALRAWRGVRRRSRESVFPPIIPDPAFPPALTIFMNALPLLAVSAGALALRTPGNLDRLLLLVAVFLLPPLALAYAAFQAGELCRLARGERLHPTLDARLRKARRRKAALVRDQTPASAPTLPAQETADAPAAKVRTGG